MFDTQGIVREGDDLVVPVKDFPVNFDSSSGSVTCGGLTIASYNFTVDRLAKRLIEYSALYDAAMTKQLADARAKADKKAAELDTLADLVAQSVAEFIDDPVVLERLSAMPADVKRQIARKLANSEQLSIVVREAIVPAPQAELPA